MSIWERTPWSLRVYVSIALADSAITAIFVSGPVPPRVFLVAFAAVVCFFLLRGVRWLWILVIVFVPLSFAANVVDGTVSWYGVALGIASLVLLLAPDTRRFFQREQSWARTLLQAVTGVVVGVLALVALLAFFLLANVLFLHIPLSTR